MTMLQQNPNSLATPDLPMLAAPGSAESLQTLASRLTGSLTLPEDAGYDAARAVRNGRIDRFPAVIVHAANTQDVVEAVRFARAQHLPLSVRGAGHHIGGKCVAENGVVIDTSALKDLSIDPVTRSARAGAGLTTGEFIRPLQDAGFVTTTGSHDSVGLAGITIAGGIGILMNKYGLVCDNLLAAEVVTSAGDILVASETKNPDLFWALRGGGGNFGVVTSLTFRIHPVEPTIAGVVMHPFPRARQVLDFYREFTRDLPDTLNAFFVIMGGPGGVPVCAITACYTGSSIEEGERLLAPLREFGPPVMVKLGPAPYTSLLDALRDHDPAGHHYAFASRGLPALPNALLDAIASRGALSSLGSGIVLYHMHGAASRVAPGDTAFAARDLPYFVGCYAGWAPGDAAPHLAWLENLVVGIEPFAAKTGYIGLSADSGESAVRDVYGDNYARLACVKAAYDPENVFRHTHNILPCVDYDI